MFGLEKEEKVKKFDFDLEIEIKENPSKAKELIEDADKKLQEIKQQIRTGTKEEELEPLGELLHGYTALIRVLKKVERNVQKKH